MSDRSVLIVVPPALVSDLNDLTDLSRALYPKLPAPAQRRAVEIMVLEYGIAHLRQEFGNTQNARFAARMGWNKDDGDDS